MVWRYYEVGQVLECGVIVKGRTVHPCHTRTNGETCLLKGPIRFEYWVGII